jgi:hypothetical protein
VLRLAGFADLKFKMLGDAGFNHCLPVRRPASAESSAMIAVVSRSNAQHRSRSRAVPSVPRSSINLSDSVRLALGADLVGFGDTNAYYAAEVQSVLPPEIRSHVLGNPGRNNNRRAFPPTLNFWP